MMTRLERAYGAKDPDVLFNGHLMTTPPFPPVGQRKDIKTYDQDKVNHALSTGQATEPVDPRSLRSTQSGITLDGVSHYLHSDEVYKDKDQLGNKNPVVYDREGTNIILSGHHRATAALLRGEQFNAVLVHGGWGGPRGRATR